MPRTLVRSSLSGAAITVVTLFGGLLLGTVVGFYVFESLPGHSAVSPSAIHISLAALPAFIGFLGGSAVWGVWMGRMAGNAEIRRMALAGMLGFAPITLVLGIGLSAVEPFVIEQIGALFPIHRVFTLMFVPSAFLIAGISAWAIGLGLRNGLLAWSLLWRVGGAAAIAFLVVNLVMEFSGWVVGGPNAAERYTMLTVMFLGNLGAALAGGAVLGWRLATLTRRAQSTQTVSR
ncbi:MAG: hypothetical protein ACT4QE_25755 [Anaerolineales bacterium]